VYADATGHACDVPRYTLDTLAEPSLYADGVAVPSLIATNHPEMMYRVVADFELSASYCD
jgi:hypothetical protein